MNKQRAKNVGLAAVTFLVSIVAVFLAVKLYARWLGIGDPQFVYENQIAMWQRDDDIGFVNKRNFAAYCFGTVRVTTNQRGFRGAAKTSRDKPAGSTRVVAMGDSVMWGTSVDEQDSVPGQLRAMLDEAPGTYEVINASVVGYSTYQELRFLETYVLPLEPDLVLVNFCINDFLPNEDPFGNVRGIYRAYLDELLDDESLKLEQRRGVEQIIAAVRAEKNIWNVMRSPIPQQLLLEVFIEIPMLRMATRCREAGSRLVFVFIPLRTQDNSYRAISDRLQAVLSVAGAECVDTAPLLVPHGDEVPGITAPGGISAGTLWSLLSNRDLNNIVRVRRIEAVQRTNNYIDDFHPTRRGNRIIAGALFRHLTQSERGVPSL